MNSDDPVLAALRSLAELDRDKDAAPEVEERLKRAFGEKRRDLARSYTEQWLIRRGTGLWTGAAAAALIAIGVAGIVLVSKNFHTTSVRANIARRDPAPRLEPLGALVSAAAAPQSLPGSGTDPEAVPVVKRKAARIPEQRPRELVTDFFPLIDVAPPFERGELVRVNVPAAAMRTVGLPVDEDHLADRVQADVLVGEEGLPLAIRFVKSLN